MPQAPLRLDTRALPDLVRQLLAGADAAFTAAGAAVPRWHYAQAPSREQVAALLSAPLDDPGLMLALAYARLVEIALQRLNEVPRKNLFAFLDAMGVSLLPPAPADVPLVFTAAPGAGPTRVPRGTAAAAPKTLERPAVTFETVDDLTVVPARLTVGLTVDPTWDRLGDRSPLLSGQSPFGFTPFVGTAPIPHRLHLGDDRLLGFDRGTTVTIGLAAPAGVSLSDVRKLLEACRYACRRADGSEMTLAPTVSIPAQGSRVLVTLPVPGPLAPETVSGLGLPQGLERRWLRVALGAPVPDVPEAGVAVRALDLEVSGTGLAPDAAFLNAGPLDTTKAFHPLGERPKIGDAFLFANNVALAVPKAAVKLSVDLREPTPGLAWEGFRFDAEKKSHAWEPVQTVLDKSAAFTQPGPVTLQFGKPLLPVQVDPVRRTPLKTNAIWVRARLTGGGWSGSPLVEALRAVGTAAAPFLAYVNDEPVDPGKPFRPFGEFPGSDAVFTLGLDLGDQATDRPSALMLDVTANLLATATVAWEYLGDTGWQTLVVAQKDTSAEPGNLARSGVIQVNVPDSGVPRLEVNGVSGRWIRARLDDGGFGREAEYVPVDPADPAKGFRLRPGTGVFIAPLVRSIRIDYTASGRPTVVRQTAFVYDDLTERNAQPVPAPFQPVLALGDPSLAPRDDDAPAFYLGFDAAFPERPVSLYVQAAPRAIRGGVVRQVRAGDAPSTLLAPLVWEYYSGAGWRPLTVVDETSDLTRSGRLTFLTPPDIAPLAKSDPTERYWLRARVSRNDPANTPQLLGVFLNAMPATQGVSVAGEVLGSGTGEPGQTFRAASTPVLPGQAVLVRELEPPSGPEAETLRAEEGGDAVETRTDPETGETAHWVRWHEVPNFLASGPASRHYTLDRASGAVTFGGGAVPPRGTSNVRIAYRSGGGAAGNVAAGAVTQLKSPPPGIAAVANPVAADGGADAETPAMVEARGPQTLRHRQRGVSAGDLEWLAREAAGTRVARVKVLPNVNRELRLEPGWVTLLIVPRGPAPRLAPGSELTREVEAFLAERAAAGVGGPGPGRLNVTGPGYVEVSVVTEVVPGDLDEAEEVKARVQAALNAFFHPLTGGPSGTGWAFGRDVYESEVYQLLEALPGVSHVKSLVLVPNTLQRRLTFRAPVTLPADLAADARVMTLDHSKAGRLAEPVAGGVPVGRVAIKGFAEGNQVARVRDLVVAASSGTTPAGIRIQSASDPAGFRVGSLVLTDDGLRSTRLAAALPAGATIAQITVADTAFVARLAPGDRLAVFDPFPMTVRWVTQPAAAGGSAPVVTLEVEPYEAERALPKDTLLATLDNRARLPLAATVPAGTVTSVPLADFSAGETLVLSPASPLGLPEVRAVAAEAAPRAHVVYVDENLLVASGSHRITMVAR